MANEPYLDELTHLWREAGEDISFAEFVQQHVTRSAADPNHPLRRLTDEIADSIVRTERSWAEQKERKEYDNG